MGTYLRNLWYLVTPGRQLKPGRMIAKTILGDPLLLVRDRDGQISALHDQCAHRGMPLSAGRFDGEALECGYHGWKYELDGRCTEIPCLSKSQPADLDKIGVRTYPCREVQGNVWVFMGQAKADLPAPPEFPEIGDRRPRVTGTLRFSCHFDHAIMGLIDPAHVPFLHQSRIWRKPERMREKERRYVPSYLGFTLARHAVPKENWFFHLLSAKPEMEISFQLPGLHVETVRLEGHRMSLVLCVTPVSDEETEFHYQVYWTMPWLNPFAPIIKEVARRVFGQDRDAVGRLSKSLKHSKRQLFIGDPDALPKWYYQLKKEYERSQMEKRPFQNPVKEGVLSWRT